MPISRSLTEQARNQMRNDSISGFFGAEVAQDIDVVQNYILGINQACLED